MPVATDSSSGLLISLSDLALLARVRRPVVSAWRKRSSRAGVGFPAPAKIIDGQEWLDGDEAVAWLAATGRGNNPDAAADLAAFSVLADSPLSDGVVFAGVTALLCLREIAGELPLEEDDILDRADEEDPDDDYLYREITALGDRLPGLARYASMLCSAAYNPGAALEKLVEDRSRSSSGRLADADLKRPARDLVAHVADALATDAEFTNPVVVDPTSTSSVAVDAARLIAKRRGLGDVATPDRSAPAARLQRRRLRVHGFIHRVLTDDGSGGMEFPEGSLIVTQLPTVGEPPTTDGAVLDALDEIAVCCSAGQRAVVVGPASALSDRLRDPEATSVRRDLLKTGLVRAIVRLPRGLAPHQGQRRLALWCLGPMAPAAGDSPFAGQPTLTADLGNVPLDEVTTEALVADLVAGLAGRWGLKSHGLQLCRVVPTSALQLSNDDLVAPGTPAAPGTVGDVSMNQLRSFGEFLGSNIEPASIPTIAVRATSVAPRTTTIASAMSARHVRVLPGHRIVADDLGERGLPVVRAETIMRTDHRHHIARIDPLVLAAEYPTSKITEPGDVVFCTAPRPAAWVDREGGSVIAFPARILRCLHAGLVPDVVAADINAQLASGKDWRGWSLRYLPDDQRAALAEILTGFARHRADLHDRLAVLDQYTTVLFSALTSGALDLDTDRKRKPEGS